MGACCGGGYGGYGYGARGYGYDADPITPGFQSSPGVVTPVGPPTVTGVAPFAGSVVGPSYVPPITTYAPPVTTYAPPIVPAPYPVAPVVSQPIFTPPVVAPVGPVGPIGPIGPIGGGFRPYGPGFGGPRVDLDPITPGRQVTPGVVTATGPSYILGR
jgi:hypothetical protein